MNVDRLRYLAQHALNGFDDLDVETAAELARADLRTMLEHMADDAVGIPFVARVEPRVGRKDAVGNGN